MKKSTVACLSKLWIILNISIFCIILLPQNIYAFDALDLHEAATTVGSKSGATDYQRALVLRHIDEIKVLRENNTINVDTFQKVMAWYRTDHLRIAKAAASNRGFTATEQQVASDAGAYRTRSDTDILISRNNSAKPISLEEVQAVEREHRRLLKDRVKKLAKNSNKKVDVSGDFKADTDFMVPPDATSPAEFQRIYDYFNSKGSATYRRPDAAIVEAKIRSGGAFTLKQGGQYVDEMIDQANEKQKKINKAIKEGSPSSKIRMLETERNKYIKRIRTVNNTLISQAGLATQLETKVIDASDFSKTGKSQYIEVLGKIAGSANATASDRGYARFTIALKLYDLPKAEQNALLKNLPVEFSKQVKEQIKLFNNETITRDETLKLRNFLQKTEGGRKLLSKYDWVFEELTKKRGGENNTGLRGLKHNTAVIADIYKSLGETSRNVGNYAHTMNLWLNVIRQVRDAKTDADLAISLGKTLASRTYYGMVAGYLYTGLVEQDGTALAKGLTILLCPTAALPEVVQSIGDSVIDITSSILFDKQFMALYLVSKFDPKSGELLRIGDYYHGENAVCQFLDDALIPGGHVFVKGIFDDAANLAKKKNLSVEVISGISAITRTALVKALSSSIYSGKPLVLQSYFPLASSCAAVANHTKTINDFTEGLGYSEKIPSNEDENGEFLKGNVYFKNLEPAAKKPLKALLKLRAEAWGKVKSNLCSGLTKSLISRNQAELALNKDDGKEAKRMHERIEKVFKELNIYTFGMKRLEADGATNIIMRNFITSTKDQQIKAMEALQRYLGNYERVLRYRQQAESYFSTLTNKSLAVRPLTVTPPLAVEPEFDANLASSYMKEILSSVSKIQSRWLWIKREALNDQQAELDSNFDKTILGNYYMEIYSHAHADTITKGASHALNPPATTLGLPLRVLTGELFKDMRYQNLRSNAFKKMSETWEKRKKLNEEFKEHYKTIVSEISITLPDEIKAGQGTTEFEYSFVTNSVNIPEEAIYTWYENDKKIATGDSIEHVFLKEGEYQLRLMASWQKTERTKREGSKETKITFFIKKVDKSKPENSADVTNEDSKEDNLEKIKEQSTSISTDQSTDSKNNIIIEKEWLARIEAANKNNDWKKLLELSLELREENRKKYNSDSITREPYLEPATLLGKYLNEVAQKKWDWFKKDVPRYLNELFNKSEAEYSSLENRVTRTISERKGTQEEVDECLETAKKEAKTLRKTIGEAKREHTVILQKLHDDQGSSVKVLGHIKDFLTKYQIPENLKISVEYKSSCLDEEDENVSKELKVNISGSKAYRISPKQTVTLNAIVSGGKAPVEIHWEGGNISPNGSTAIFAASTPGTYTVQVTAKGASGQSKSDSVTFIVKELNLPKLSGLANEVYYGSTTSISVDTGLNDIQEDNLGSKVDCKKDPDNPFCVSTKPCKNPFDENCRVKISQDSDGSSVGEYVPEPDKEGPYDVPSTEEQGEYEYIWQSSKTGIEFDPPSGKDLSVNVTFGNIGDVEIWAQVLKEGETIGETEVINTKVIPPNFTMAIEPKSLFVGDEAQANISLQPKINNKYLNFRWLPMGDNVQALGESNEGKSYALKLKSIKPTTIEVLIWAQPYAEEQVAHLKQVVSAKPYKVEVKVLGPVGPKPRIWKKGEGLVEVENAIAVHQNIRLQAIISPEPNTSLRYSWKLNEYCHFASGESGRDVTLNRSQIGTCIATVTIEDQDENLLGKGSGSFSVTISQHQIDTAKHKPKDQQKAQKLLQEGRKLWKKGKLQQAISKVVQAQRVVGKDKGITKTLNAMQKQKKEIDDKLVTASDLIKKGKFDDADKVLSGAANISDNYAKYKEVLKQLTDAKKKADEIKQQVAKLLKDAKVLKDAGKLDEVVAVLKKGSTQFPANKEISDRLNDVQKQQEDALKKMNEGQAQWGKGLLEKAISTLKGASKIDPSNKQIVKVLEGMQGQKKLMDNALKKTDGLIGQKKLKQAQSVLKKAEYISKQHLPYIAMVEKLKKAVQEEKEQEQIVKLLKKTKAFKNAGKLSEAIVVLEKGEKQLPKNEEIKKLLEEIKGLIKEKEEKKQSDANEKMQEGQAQWKNGALDQAVSTIEEATRIDPFNRQIVKVLKAFKSDKKKMDDLLKEVDGLIREQKLDQAQNILQKLGNVGSKYPPYMEMTDRLNDAKTKEAEKIRIVADELKKKKLKEELVRKLISEGKTLEHNNKLKSALGKYKDAQKLDPSPDIGTLIFNVAKRIDSQQAIDIEENPNPGVSDSEKVQAKYIGCYKEKGHKEKVVPSLKNRVMNGYNFRGDMTVKKCSESCLGKGFKYAGLQYANECFCDDSYGIYGKADNCNMPCTGNKNEMCGGAWANSVYALNGKSDVEEKPTSDIASLVGSWSFGRSKHYGKPVQEHLCNIVLTNNRVKGKGYEIRSCHANESFWILEGKILLFTHLDGTVTTKFKEVKPNYWEGTYVGSPHSAEGVVHYLKRTKVIDATNRDRQKGLTGRIQPDTPQIPVNNKKKQTIKAKYGPPSAANTWKRYSIPLTADSFGLDTQTFQQVMADVSTFRIATEMHDGKDVGGIDKVKIGNIYLSDFNGGTDGWNADGDGTMEWVSSGGISGGYLQISDWASGELHWAVAPASWSGNWQGLIGSSIDFYYRTDHPSYSAVVEISNNQQNRLGLVAKSMTILQGSSASVTISPYPVSSKDLVVSLTSSNTKCITVIGNTIVPGGQASIESKVNAVAGASECTSVFEASAEGYGKSRITLSVKENVESAIHNPKPTLDTTGIDGIVDIDKVEPSNGQLKNGKIIIFEGKTKTSTSYTPNNKGDIFKGGHWAGASGRSDWIEKDFASPQLVTGIYIGRASTDVTTKGFRLVLKLKKTNGQWIIIDELHDTNINRTALSGGAIGKSIPSYTKKLATTIEATAFRLEFSGHGWFDATDIRIYTSKVGGEKDSGAIISSAEPTSTSANQAGGYWKLVNIKGSVGRECTPKEVSSDYYRGTISGGEGDVTIAEMVRKRNHTHFSARGTWQRPPDVMYPDSIIKIPLSIKKIVEDTSQYWRSMSIYIDTWDMECGATGGGGKIGGLKIDHKSPKSIHETIQWKVKKAFQKKAGEKLTIRVCYNGVSICGNDIGWQYHYEWLPESSKVSTPTAKSDTGNIDGIVDIDKIREERVAAEKAALAQRIKAIREAAEKAKKIQEEKDANYPQSQTAIKLINNVPTQNSSTFKRNVDNRLRMQTTSWNKVPYRMAPVYHGTIRLNPNSRAVLTGNAAGTTGWNVDNFLLIELSSGGSTTLLVVGNNEPVTMGGSTIRKIGRDSQSFGAGEIDLTPYIQSGRPTNLKVTAFDYGGVGKVSNVYLVMK